MEQMQIQVHAFLLLRVRLLFRHLLLLGAWYGSVVTAAVFLYFLVLFHLPAGSNGTLYTSVVLVLFPVLAIHFSRKDVRLLKSLSSNTYAFLWSEYNLLLIPGLVLLLVKGFYTAASVVAALAQILPLVTYDAHPKNRKLLAFSFIPPWQYEWRSGLRKNTVIMVLLFLLSLTALIYPFVSFFFVWIMHAIIVSFYQQHESEAIIRQAQTIRPAILLNKVLSGIAGQLALFLPLALIHALIHRPSHAVVLFLMLLFTVSLGFSIVVKYRYFQPGETGGPASIYQTLAIISPLIPFLLPFPLLLGWAFWKKANHTISCYDTSNRKP